MTEQRHRRIIRDPETDRITSTSRTVRDRLAAKGLFPERIRISERAAGYYEDEVLEWVNTRPRASDEPPDIGADPRRRGVGKRKKDEFSQTASDSKPAA